MSYGPCKACPKAVAAWMMSPSGVIAVPESVLFCLDHLKILLKGRSDASLRDARNASRRWCACGREIYLLVRGDGVTRTACASCEVPGTDSRQKVVDVTTICTPVSVKVPEDWYSQKLCQGDDCEAKLCWILKDGTGPFCVKHGAATAEETQHA